MAISAPTVGAYTETSSSASTTVPYPTTVAAGACLVLCGVVKFANAAAVTLPSGWTLVAQFSGNANTSAPDLFVAIKANAAGTEGGTNLTVTHVTGGPTAWQILAFAGVDTSTPLDTTASTFDGTGSFTTLPGINVVTAGAALVAVGAQNSSNTATPPVGFTETGDLVTGTAALEVSYQLGASAGSSGSQTINWTGSVRNLGVLLALRPASGGGGGGVGSTPTIGTYTERTAEASTAVPYPTTVNAGDQLVLTGSLTSASNTAVTVPTGWTQVAQLTGTANTAQPHVFMAIKKAVGNEGGTTLAVTHGSVVSAWQILSFPSIDPTTPQDTTATTVDQSTSGSATVLPAATVVTTGSTVIIAVAQNTSGSTATPPTGFTETGDRASGTRSFEVSYKTNFATGTTGTETVNWSGSGKGVGVMAVLRAATVTVVDDAVWYVPDGLGGWQEADMLISDGAGEWL